MLPRYAALAPLAFAYMQGSVVRGFTERADLDVIAVWDAPAVPTDRAALVDGLDERRPPAATVVDYRDVHLDRFVFGGQEYNIGHHTLAEYRALLSAAMEGRELPGERIIGPLTLVFGLSTAELLVDTGGSGRALQAAVPRAAVAAFDAAIAPTTAPDVRISAVEALIRHALPDAAPM